MTGKPSLVLAFKLHPVLLQHGHTLYLAPVASWPCSIRSLQVDLSAAGRAGTTLVIHLGEG